MIRKYSCFILSLCLTAFLFIACSKNDDSITPVNIAPLNNSFSFDEQEYNTVEGYVQKLKSGRFELGFFTKNLSFDIIKGNKASEAIGSFVLMQVTQTGNELQNGTFDLTTTSSNGLFLNFNFDTGDIETRLNPKSGKITIGGIGNIRSISYQLNFEGEKVLKGSYNGILEIKSTP